jgi:hypothetical protein
MQLVPEWKKAWKWFSVQALFLIGVIEAVWLTLPPETLALIPADTRAWIITGLAIFGALGRVVKQGEA